MEHEYCSQVIEDPENLQNEIDVVEECPKESDELLIDAIRGYPHLYNSALKEYRDVQLKENSWSEIALIMNMSVTSCQNRWLRLRERFTKEQRLQEAESRSGSGANHRSQFYLYNNMLFLKNHIKRRKSFTNVNVPTKKTATMSNVSSNILSAIGNTSLLHSTNCDTYSINTLDSNRSSSINSNVFCDKNSDNSMATSINFSCIPQEVDRNQSNQIEIDYAQNSNKFQNIQNERNILRIPQVSNIYDKAQQYRRYCMSISPELNISETRSDITSPLPRNDSRNSQTGSEISNDSMLSPTMQSSYRGSNSGKIKNKSGTQLESSLTALNNTLQKRFSPQRSNLTEQNIWNLNTLTPEKSFGLLVATELERIPEPERTIRKQAITEILWKPIQ